MSKIVNPSSWTPEQEMQAWKEGVTALIGLILVSFTVFMAYRAFGFAGKQEMTDAKDIVQLTIGLAGVVLGYYFGRVPADARSTQAQEQANTATAHAEKVNAKSQELIAHVDNMVASGVIQANGVKGDAQMAQDLQRLRRELHEMSR